MLAFILALTVGLASLVFFFSAFFAPKLHRKDDFLWSGVGFFYALVLWLCSQRLTGGVLLGQVAATILILSFAWQTLKLRASIANAENLPALKSFSLLDWLSGGLRKPKATKPQPPQAPTEPTASEPKSTVEPEVKVEMTEPAEVMAEQVEEILEVVEEIAETSTASPEPATISESLPELPSDAGETVELENTSEAHQPPTEPEAPEPEAGPSLVTKRPSAPAKAPSVKPSKPGFFSRLFGRRPSTQLETIKQALVEEGEWDELEETAIEAMPVSAEPETAQEGETPLVSLEASAPEADTLPNSEPDSLPVEITTETPAGPETQTALAVAVDEPKEAVVTVTAESDDPSNPVVVAENTDEDEVEDLDDLDDLLEAFGGVDEQSVPAEPEGPTTEDAAISVDTAGPEISEAPTSVETSASSDSSSADSSDSSSSASDL